ncbi:MAG: dihydroneopterin aldolase [Saprospiraceae bacterium]|jgi:dihydroneopterin aldolase|nr:dihydroneopterin aldolase [Saprospiraceae bacterium]
MALIALEDVQFFSYHGFYEEEQILGGEFIIDLYVETQIMRAARLDDLADTVNYETLYFICQSEMKKTRSLIETVAQSIVDRIETLFDSVRGVKIRLRKLNPPMGGRVGSAFVEIETGSFRKR